MNTPLVFFLGMLASAMVGMAIHFALPCTQHGRILREAVKVGVARYVADDEGNVRFEWIVPEPKR